MNAFKIARKHTNTDRLFVFLFNKLNIVWRGSNTSIQDGDLSGAPYLQVSSTGTMVSCDNKNAFDIMDCEEIQIEDLVKMVISQTVLKTNNSSVHIQHVEHLYL